MPEDTNTPPRRSVLAGAAWSVPVIAAAAATPLASASRGKCGTLTWTATTRAGDVRTGTVTAGGSSAKVTVTHSTRAGTPNAGNFDPYTGAPANVGAIGNLLLWQQSSAANTPARQRLVFASTKPMESLTFQLSDFTTAIAYSDTVSIPDFSPRAITRVASTPAITGAGTIASPWVRESAHSTAGPTSIASVSLGPTPAGSPRISTFTMEYANAVTDAPAGSGSQQWISISNPLICF